MRLYEQINKMRSIMGLNENFGGDDVSVTPDEIRLILKGYLECALWTEEERLNDEYGGEFNNVFNDREDGEDNEMGKLIQLTSKMHNKGIDSFTREDMEDNSVIKAYEDIKNFISLAGGAVFNAIDENGCEQLGHDIWLVRNRHGAGFFDRGYDDHIEKILMDAGQKLGEVDLFINDQMKLSFSNENI